jgi:predicted RecB family nuclease
MDTRLTASQLYSHLTCPHRVAMDVAGDPALRDEVSPFVQLLWERGVAHERELVAGLGASCLDLSTLSGEAKESATREAIARSEPLIYSGRLSVHELLGEPDLLRLEQGGYVAIDIKSGAGREGNKGEDEGRLRKHYGVQLALYTDILEQMGLAAGRYGYIQDVQGIETRYDLSAPMGPRSASLWEHYLKTRAAARATLAAPQASSPANSSACKLCVWHGACFARLNRDQDLTLVPELGRAARDALREEFPTLRHLSEADVGQYIEADRTAFAGVGAKSLRRFQRRAAMLLQPGAQPYLTRPVSWPRRRVELFFDIETDPLRELCYLHGFVIREAGEGGDAKEHFRGIFANDVTDEAEREAFGAAMDLFRRHADALVVHYSKYERTEYRRLAGKYPQVATQQEIEVLFSPPRALDLYLDVVKPVSEWPTYDFSIKSLAKHCGFSWRDADPSGASSIEWFDRWARTRDPRFRQRLLAYNEDDCRAMRVVLDRLKTLPVRPD